MQFLSAVRSRFSSGIVRPVVQWLDSDVGYRETDVLLGRQLTNVGPDKKIDWVRCFPFIILHLGCLGVYWVGWSPIAVIICLLSFWFRMFAITAFYHRYFSHRSYKVNRVWQFLFAILGNTAAQRGPLWWASHHRLHHKESDSANDLHSPVVHGFFWSHMGWFMSKKGYATKHAVVKDWSKFPELVFLNRFDALVPVVYAVLMFSLGAWLESTYPHAGVTGGQVLVWGFFISTVLLFHATFTINSLGHVWGRRRFNTKDQSRNNPWLAALTLGEGWHNNHHRYAISARQGFYWYEVDVSYYILKLMNLLGIVGHLNDVPERILTEGKRLDKSRKQGNASGVGDLYDEA